MNPSPSLRILGLAAAVTLASCGYAPMYAPAGGGSQASSKVQVGAVEVVQNTKNVGQRRTAQTVAQELKLNFPNTGTEMDSVDVTITEETSTLAIERTAITRRAQINLYGTLTLSNPNGDRLLVTQLSTSAPYNVENTPYSTETGKTYARLTAARNLAAEVSRRLYLYYSTHPQGTSKVKKSVPAKPATK